MKPSQKAINIAKLKNFCSQNQIDKITFMRINPIGNFFYYALYYFPIPFLLALIDMWLDNKIEQFMRYRPSKSIHDTTYLKINDVGGIISFVDYSLQKFYFEADEELEFFNFSFNSVRFVYLEDEETFVNVQTLFTRQPVRDILEKFKHGRYESKIPNLIETFGTNEMTVSPPNIWQILFNESFSINGLFESFAIFLNIYNEYYLNAIILFGLVIMERYTAVKGSFDSYNSTMEQVLKKSNTLVIRRNEDEEFQKSTTNSENLVPGDIIEITKGLSLTVDAILINGSCIFNEGGITGVATNELKIAAKTDLFLDDSNLIPKQHLLLAGSTCLFLKSDINEGCLAIVVGTGYTTFKGALLRQLLMPKKIIFESFDQAMTLVYFLIGVWFIAEIIYLIYWFTYDGVVKLTAWNVFSYSVCLFFSIVKPCLPYCIFMGIESSKNRLESMKIETTNKFKIIQSSRCRSIFFDKTGTITMTNNKIAEVFPINGLSPELHSDAIKNNNESQNDEHEKHNSNSLYDQFVGILHSKTFNKESKEKISNGTYFGKELTKISDLFTHETDYKAFVYALNFNNSIIKVGQALVGDELDLELYHNSPYEMTITFNKLTKTTEKAYHLRKEYEDHPGYPTSFKVVKDFEYESDLKRNTTIVQSNEGDYYLISKGAPEEIIDLCLKESIPHDYQQKMFGLATSGKRLIGFAYQKISAEKIINSRKDLEKNLIFLGLITNESFIRDGASKTITNLAQAHIKLIMMTGDNLFSSLSVAKQVNLVQDKHVIYICMSPGLNEDSTLKKPVFLNFSKINNKLGLEEEEIDIVRVDEERKHVKYDTPDITSELYELMGSENNIVLIMEANIYERVLSTLRPEDLKDDSDVMKFLHQRCLIFARCKPLQKKLILENFKRIASKKYSVMFVGDEANDADAIDAADISFMMKKSHLSFKSNFTSSNSDFSSVEALIREGKCSSESGFLTFKFFLFQMSLVLVMTFFLYKYFICLIQSHGAILDLVISLSFCEYINNFPATRKMKASIPSASMFNSKFMVVLILHCAAACLAMIGAYIQVTHLTYYRTPFEIIPYNSQKSLDLGLEKHKVYEGIFFFNCLILLQTFGFIFTNWRSEYRVTLFNQKETMYYTVFCLLLFFYMASLSEVDEPSFIDSLFIYQFNIGKTHGLLQIYFNMIFIYSLSAYLIQLVCGFYFNYRSYEKIYKEKNVFVQVVDEIEQE